MRTDSKSGRKRPLVVAAALTVLALMAAACSSGGDSSSSDTSAGGSAPLSQSSITMLATTQAFDAPTVIALKKGYFDEVGLDVEVRRDTSGADMVAAVVGGSAQVGLLSTTPPLAAAAQGAGVKAIGVAGHATELSMVIDKEAAQRAGIPENGSADEKLRALADSGLKIAVGAPGSGTYVQVGSLLSARGIDPDQAIQREALEGPASFIAAFRRGDVDGFVWIPPTTIQVEEDEIVRIDFRELDEYKGLDFIVLITSDSMISAHPDTLQAFCDAWVRGWNDAVENPTEAAQILKEDLFPDLDMTLVERSFESSRTNFGPTPAITRSGFDKAVALSNLGRPTPINVSYDEFVDNTFMNNAITEAGLDVPLGD